MKTDIDKKTVLNAVAPCAFCCLTCAAMKNGMLLAFPLHISCITCDNSTSKDTKKFPYFSGNFFGKKHLFKCHI